MPPRPWFRWSLAAAAALALLLSQVAFSTVFSSYPLDLSINLISPPLVLLWFPGLDGEEVSLSLGANYTSYAATVKATRAPNVFCNGNMDVPARDPSSGVLWPLCWVPLTYNTVFEWSNYSLGSGTQGSLHIYNHTPTTLWAGQVAYFAAGMAQMFFEPSTSMGDDINGLHYIRFCYNASLSYAGLAYVTATLNVTVYKPGGPKYTAAADVSSTLDGSLVCVDASFTPSESTTPDFYVFYTYILVTVQPLFWLFRVRINSLDVYFDNASLLLNLTSPGVYYTAPLMYAINESILGFNASIRLQSETGLSIEAAWIMSPSSRPFHSVDTMLVYHSSDPLPAASSDINLDDNTSKAGVLAFYQVYNSLPGGASHVLVYHNGDAVSVSYPVNISAVDPPSNLPPLPPSVRVVKLRLQPAGSAPTRSQPLTQSPLPLDGAVVDLQPQLLQAEPWTRAVRPPVAER